MWAFVRARKRQDPTLHYYSSLLPNAANGLSFASASRGLSGSGSGSGSGAGAGFSKKAANGFGGAGAGAFAGAGAGGAASFFSKGFWNPAKGFAGAAAPAGAFLTGMPSALTSVFFSAT